MAKVDVKYPCCEQVDTVKKYGSGRTGHQRYRCQACRPCYEQLRYPRYCPRATYQH